MGYKVLAINPGSTSTKVALYDEERPLLDLTLRHSTEEISRFANVIDQLDWRRGLILSALREQSFNLKDLSAVIGRGGLIRPIPAGVYEVNSRMRYDLRNAPMKHACNLGGLLAAQIAHMAGVKAYIADPPVVDEMDDAARITGMPMCPRKPIFHALNQKAVAKRYAKEAGKPYESLRLVVVHMGGGVSVGAHEDGKVVDVFSAFDGDGAFSPERAGGVPCAALVKMCFSGKYTEKEISAKLIGKGGLNSYLGTNDMREVTKRANEGDAKAAEVKQAFLLQVAKDIGAMACVLNGKVDQIVITGGIAYGEDVVAKLKERCGWIAPVTVYPGEDELLALAQGALRVMNGEEQVKQY